MSDSGVPQDLAPRFVHLVGAGTRSGPPISATGYTALHFGVEIVTLSGVHPAVVVGIDESDDGKTWSRCPGELGSLGSCLSVTGKASFDSTWIREVVELSGQHPELRCWLRGRLVKRAPTSRSG